MASTVGRTVTELLIARPVTARHGSSGVILNCCNQPRDLSDAMPVPIAMAEPSAPYAAMPTIDAAFQSS